MRVGFDAAALVLNRAGEYRYASALRGALRGRDDVELHELWPGRRVPRTLPARIALQAAVQGLWYPLAVPAAARRAKLDLVHHPRYAVSPEPGLRVPVVVTMHDVLVLSAPELSRPRSARTSARWPVPWRDGPRSCSRARRRRLATSPSTCVCRRSGSS
jgi:hypothetical protein